MPTMTVAIKGTPSFSAVGEGFQFSGAVELPEVVTGPIQINSMRLHYGYARTYRVAPYLTAVCGDTTFRTDYFTISETGTSSLKDRTLNVPSWHEGTDHLLRQNGRTITFTVAREDSTSSNLIDRPRGGDMELTINYTLLFERSPFRLSADSLTMGGFLYVDVDENAINADFSHTATLELQGLTVSGHRIGPGEIELFVPRSAEWLAAIPDAVTASAAVTLETAGAGQTGDSTQYVSLVVPGDVAPSINGLNVTPINGRVPARWEAYIKGESAALIEIIGASPGAGSRIASSRIECGGYAANELSITTGKLMAAGVVTITATVTDSRGRMAVYTDAIDVLSYTPPYLTSFDAWRTNETGVMMDNGTQIRLRATFGITSIFDNAATFSVLVNGQKVATSFSVDGDMATAILAGPWDATKGHEVTLVIWDEITLNSGNPASLFVRIPSASVPMNLMQRGGEFGAAFGMYQEHEKRLSIPEDWRYYRGERDLEAWVQELVQQAGGGGSGGGVDMKAVLAAVYPVGSIYLAINPTSPAELFGGGWIQLDDRLLDGSDGSTLTVHLWQRVEEGEMLPEITEADEGRFLRVVNGEMVWDKLEWKEAN